VSPDGQWLLFASGFPRMDRKGVSAAAIVRRMDGTEWRELPGTAGGYAYFWSPDSRQVGFVQGASLKKVDLLGSQPQTLCSECISAPGLSSGGTWSQHGLIVFSPGVGQVLLRMADGGEIRPVTELDSARQETEHFFPSFRQTGAGFHRSHPHGNHCIMLGSIDPGLPNASCRAIRGVCVRLSLVRSATVSLLALPPDADQGR
jgi:hypothetical protein